MEKSIRQMLNDGEAKRADSVKVHIDLIQEEPGFNLRQEGPELDASIEALADYILKGGIYPPLEVRPAKGPGVLVVDGHRRRRALLLARERGAPIEWVSVILFSGNDADRITRVMTSAEGRPLQPLEVAMGYKRLSNLGLTPDEIAGRVGKTRQHVDQLLILANSPTAVQKMVAKGDVSAAVAVKVARTHGEEATGILREELNKAKAAGKAKVTDGTIQGKPLPPKVVSGMVEELDTFVRLLPNETRQKLALLERAEPSSVPDDSMVTVPATALLALMGEHSKVSDARQKLAEKLRRKAEKMAQRELAA